MAAVFVGRPTCMVKWDDVLTLNPPVVLVLHPNVYNVPLLKPARRLVTDCEMTCNSSLRLPKSDGPFPNWQVFAWTLRSRLIVPGLARLRVGAQIQVSGRAHPSPVGFRRRQSLCPR